MIYLDNNATTPISPQVFDAMRPFLGVSYGNPSSAHAVGREAAKAVAKSRESVAAMLGARFEEEIVFTSCGTESDNWAILGTLGTNSDKRQIITTRVEHEAVRKLCEKLETQGFEVIWLETDESGSLDIDSLRSALTPDTAVVSVMLANNETGILFPVTEIAALVKEHSNAIVHVDGVNAAGKVPIDLKETEIDLFSISGHKFHGPKGVGALYVRDGVRLPSIIIGGGQESGRRAGTEAVHQIVGLGAAADLVKDMAPMEGVGNLRRRLENEILDKIPNSRLNGTSDPARRLPNTLSISFENTNGEMILAHLDDIGVCVSTGSACNAAGHIASPVLQAMNIPYSYAMGAIRFSLSRFNTREEIDFIVDRLPGIIESLRQLAA
jgi:cysteine desulfurase